MLGGITITGDSSDSFSIRQQVFKMLREVPHAKPQFICKRLGLDYKKHGKYINTLKSNFNSNYKIGSPQIPHRRIFVWECVVEDFDTRIFYRKRAIHKLYGWKPVMQPQRNPFLIFRGDHGTIHWYKSGKVLLYLRGRVQLARVKELFSEGFSFLSDEHLNRYLNAPLRTESRKMTFDVGKEIPRFDIRYYEKSHGIRVFTDGSHPTSVHVLETEPFWLGGLENVTDKLAHEIEEHLALIQDYRKEAKERRYGSLYGDLKRLFRGVCGWFKRT